MSIFMLVLMLSCSPCGVMTAPCEAGLVHPDGPHRFPPAFPVLSSLLPLKPTATALVPSFPGVWVQCGAPSAHTAAAEGLPAPHTPILPSSGTAQRGEMTVLGDKAQTRWHEEGTRGPGLNWKIEINWVVMTEKKKN